MIIQNKHYTSIWLTDDDILQIIDQTLLPHQFKIVDLNSLDELCHAIKSMQVRGAGLIGVTAAYGIYLAVKNYPLTYSQGDVEDYSFDSWQNYMLKCQEKINDTRPTAKNLSWALQEQFSNWHNLHWEQALILTKNKALEIAQADIDCAKKIGEFGKKIIEEIYLKKKSTVNILTHCNAGWLAFTDYGSALAPIYTAHAANIPIHVWVDETRPRNQGANLTAFELSEQGLEHSLIVDNTGGHLMQNGMVDMVIVGADRVCLNGDVANKIGTYLKALAAYDNNIPFYVALPSSTFDFELMNGKDIPIEQRDSFEVTHIQGWLEKDELNENIEESKLASVRICPKNTKAVNYAFDVTPSRLISGLITERGVCKANQNDILNFYPEKKMSD